MNKHETNGKKDSAGYSGFGATHGDFKKMFEMMGKCCEKQNGFPDCSDMKKFMMENCCAKKQEGKKAD